MTQKLNDCDKHSSFLQHILKMLKIFYKILQKDCLLFLRFWQYFILNVFMMLKMLTQIFSLPTFASKLLNFVIFILFFSHYLCQFWMNDNCPSKGNDAICIVTAQRGQQQRKILDLQPLDLQWPRRLKNWQLVWPTGDAY